MQTNFQFSAVRTSFSVGTQQSTETTLKSLFNQITEKLHLAEILLTQELPRPCRLVEQPTLLDEFIGDQLAGKNAGLFQSIHALREQLQSQLTSRTEGRATIQLLLNEITDPHSTPSAFMLAYATLLKHERQLHKSELSILQFVSLLLKIANTVDDPHSVKRESLQNNLICLIMTGQVNPNLTPQPTRNDDSILKLCTEQLITYYKGGCSAADSMGQALAHTLIQRLDNPTFFKLAFNTDSQVLDSLLSRVEFTFLAPEARAEPSAFGYLYLLIPRNADHAQLLHKVLDRYIQGNENTVWLSVDRRRQVVSAVLSIFSQAAALDRKVTQDSRLCCYMWQRLVSSRGWSTGSPELMQQCLAGSGAKEILQAGYFGAAMKLADAQGLVGFKKWAEALRLSISGWRIPYIQRQLRSLIGDGQIPT